MDPETSIIRKFRCNNKYSTIELDEIWCNTSIGKLWKSISSNSTGDRSDLFSVEQSCNFQSDLHRFQRCWMSGPGNQNLPDQRQQQWLQQEQAALVHPIRFGL